jgi:hypothetical protein
MQWIDSDFMAPLRLSNILFLGRRSHCNTVATGSPQTYQYLDWSKAQLLIMSVLGIRQ